MIPLLGAMESLICCNYSGSPLISLKNTNRSLFCPIRMIRVIHGLNRQTIFSISLRSPRFCVKKTGALKRRERKGSGFVQRTKVLRYCHYSGSPRKTQKKTGKKLDEIFRLFSVFSACVRQA